MDPLFPDAPERTDAGNRPLDRNARAAVTALARALEVFDRPAARRAALRAQLADRIAVAAGIAVIAVTFMCIMIQKEKAGKPMFVNMDAKQAGMA